MSDLLIRQLAEACAPRIAAKVEEAVVATVRAELPGVVADVLREQYAGETVNLYVAKRSAASRRDRDAMLRQCFNGRNAAQLSVQTGLSIRQVMRIVAIR